MDYMTLTLGAYLFLTQIVIPYMFGEPLFPIFRRDKSADTEEKEEKK